MVSVEVEGDPLFPRVCAAGASLRRIERSTEPDGSGRRSVWHQGKELTELTSWEDAQGGIERQELIFMGFALDFRRGFGLRTGSVHETANDGSIPGIDLIEYDRDPTQRVLELAARLLRETKRDFYTQHLLQQLNDALTTRFNRPQTQVFELNRWYDRLHRASQKIHRVRRRHVQVTIYVGIGLAAGAMLAAIILKFL